jgi:hypothetical protein
MGVEKKKGFVNERFKIGLDSFFWLLIFRILRVKNEYLISMCFQWGIYSWTYLKLIASWRRISQVLMNYSEHRTDFFSELKLPSEYHTHSVRTFLNPNALHELSAWVSRMPPISDAYMIDVFIPKCI